MGNIHLNLSVFMNGNNIVAYPLHKRQVGVSKIDKEI